MKGMIKLSITFRYITRSNPPIDPTKQVLSLAGKPAQKFIVKDIA